MELGPSICGTLNNNDIKNLWWWLQAESAIIALNCSGLVLGSQSIRSVWSYNIVFQGHAVFLTRFLDHVGWVRRRHRWGLGFPGQWWTTNQSEGEEKKRFRFFPFNRLVKHLFLSRHIDQSFFFFFFNICSNGCCFGTCFKRVWSFYGMVSIKRILYIFHWFSNVLVKFSFIPFRRG